MSFLRAGPPTVLWYYNFGTLRSRSVPRIASYEIHRCPVREVPLQIWNYYQERMLLDKSTCIIICTYIMVHGTIKRLVNVM